MKLVKIASALATILAMVSYSSFSQASTTVLATDDFSYDDGPLVGNGGWMNQSGNEGTLLVSSGEVVVTQDSGSEDGELIFSGTKFSYGIVTAEFDIRVTAPAAMTGDDFEYFAHFSDNESFAFLARLDVVTPNDTGDYTLGISSTSSTADAMLPVDFAFDTVVPVALSFNIDTGVGSVTAGGSTVSSSSISLGELVDAFNLRQSSSSSDETIFLDNLVISHTVPEPSTILMALMAASGVGAVAMRRRLG